MLTKMVLEMMRQPSKPREVRDGYVAIGNDCDDGNVDVFPAPEVCDEVDNNCDGQIRR